MMPVKIRLKRMGSKRRPFYRFIVVDSRDRRDGAFLEEVGYYNPIVTPHDIKVDEDRIFEWLGKGAQVSDGARDILRTVGILQKWNLRKAGVKDTGEPAAATETAPAKAAPVEAAAPAKQEPPAAEEPAEEKEAAEQMEEKAGE